MRSLQDQVNQQCIATDLSDVLGIDPMDKISILGFEWVRAFEIK